MDPSLQHLPVNKEARDKIIQRVITGKRLITIMKGLEQEEDKKQQLAANLLFSSPLEKYTAKDVESIKKISVLPPSKKNYEKVLGLLDHKNMSAGIHSALDNVYQYDSELKRCESGMNLATIMTEYRRKQLMDALLFENECDDPYEGRDKLKIFLATNHPELLENENTKNSTTLKTEELLTIKLQPFKKQNKKLQSTSNNNEFIPKWGSYETMKNRWQYIRPQLKQLKHEEDTYAPLDANRSYVLDDGFKIQSNYQEASSWYQRSYPNIKKSTTISPIKKKR
jgi:hypothetical protein